MNNGKHIISYAVPSVTLKRMSCDGWRRFYVDTSPTVYLLALDKNCSLYMNV